MLKVLTAANSTLALVANSNGVYAAMIRSYVLTAMAVLFGVGCAVASPVEHVSVQLDSVEAPMPKLVQKRISASIQTVGNHVFLNHDDGEILIQQESYNRVVNDIVNRVLIGYTVDDVQIIPGVDTKLLVRIRPWGETIRHVETTLDYGALPALGCQMAEKDLTGSKTLVENLLLGLPVDALDWANGAVKSVMENELEALLPEFYPHVTIVPGAKTTVNIYFMPKLPIVRNVNVDVDSENLPKIIFLNTRKNMEQRYAGLEGLPVAFVQRHADDLNVDLMMFIKKQWVIHQYKLRVSPSLDVGENMNIHLKSETDFYDIQAGAYIDMGRDDKKRPKPNDNTVLTAHVGRKISGHHEFYGEAEFKPSSVSWNLIPGYFYRWGKNTRLGYQFESEDDSHHVWLRQRLSDRWQLRFDHNFTHVDDEFGLAYRLHEYLSLEYIVSDHDYWLRIIGHL